MSDQRNEGPSRARRVTGMAGLVMLVLALGLWLGNQQVGGGPPQREKRSAGERERSPAEHEHTNHLIDETSPYLLQHAHNPVNWHPWGEEAFKKAKREDKPIFLSVGYSTCYWCHVMEKESFEDEEVAALLNKHFVSVKVDREERPDVDEQYMLATQLMTRRGGWPNSVWLTPEGKPWMAGTYIPKSRFMALLERLAELWEQRREEVEQQADRMAQTIARIMEGGGQAGDQPLNADLLKQAVGQIVERYDEQHGGFGDAPKFPPHGKLALLIRHYRETQQSSLLKPIAHTLDAMWLGGMHDHVGGGFHRYATDRHWLLPHFEKMLYDNAQLIQRYTDGYKLTGHERYRRAVADVFRWVTREMTAPGGAFYSAIDSGEVDKEGETYLWHVDELRDVLGEEAATRFADVYNFEENGNFTEEATGERPGTNIPHLDQPLRAIAEQRGADPEAFAQRLRKMRDKLLARRQTWVQPHKDDKILTSWNGLMIGALADAGRKLDQPRYVKAAAAAADFILQHMKRDDGTLMRTYRAGQAKQPGYLDDYAYLARGLVELHRATDDPRWLHEADRLAGAIVRDFQDKRGGGFFYTSDDHEDLLARSKHLSGGGNVPNANGVAVQVLSDLAELTGNDGYRKAAEKTLKTLAWRMAQQPVGLESLLVAAADHLDDPTGAADPPKPKPADRADASNPDDPQGNEAFNNDQPVTSKRVKHVNIDAHATRLDVKAGGSLELAVALTIDDGWHLYGRNPGMDFLIPASVSVESSDAFTIGEIERPEPHRMVDPILEKPVNTYTGRVWFRVPVSIHSDAPSKTVALALKVRTQACDDSRCLSPETTTLRLPLRIGGQGREAKTP